jgi:hypothetical protein
MFTFISYTALKITGIALSVTDNPSIILPIALRNVSPFKDMVVKVTVKCYSATDGNSPFGPKQEVMVFWTTEIWKCLKTMSCFNILESLYETFDIINA